MTWFHLSLLISLVSLVSACGKGGPSSKLFQAVMYFMKDLAFTDLKTVAALSPGSQAQLVFTPREEEDFKKYVH